MSDCKKLEEEMYEKAFKRIDEYHSIAYHGEEFYPDSPFWEDKTEISKSALTQHETFPAWQEGVYTLVYIDDEYTYVNTTTLCDDGHLAPPAMSTVVRFDKMVDDQ